MARQEKDERRRNHVPTEVETRGGLWSLSDGHRLPNLIEAASLISVDPAHPARLLPSDLDNPENFHSRLADWLLRQG